MKMQREMTTVAGQIAIGAVKVTIVVTRIAGTAAKKLVGHSSCKAHARISL